MAEEVDVTGTEIREFRKLHGWNQKRLAKALDISQPALSKMERKDEVITAPVMRKYILPKFIEIRKVLEPERGATPKV